MADERVVDVLANLIRTVDGNHDKGAGELAEKIIGALEFHGLAVVPYFVAAHHATFCIDCPPKFVPVSLPRAEDD